MARGRPAPGVVGGRDPHAGGCARRQQHDLRLFDALVLRPYRFQGVDWQRSSRAASNPQEGFMFDRESVSAGRFS